MEIIQQKNKIQEDIEENNNNTIIDKEIHGEETDKVCFV